LAALSDRERLVQRRGELPRRYSALS
jgi:hypothetical protein